MRQLETGLKELGDAHEVEVSNFKEEIKKKSKYLDMVLLRDRRGVDNKSPGDLYNQELTSVQCSSTHHGSYGRLINHLEACGKARIISSEDHAELKSAMKDIQNHGRPESRCVTTRLPGTICEDSKAYMAIHGFSVSHKASQSKERIAHSQAHREKGSEFDHAHSQAILGDLNFNVLASPDIVYDLPLLVDGLRAPFDLLGYFNVNPARLESWIEAIQGKYNENVPYHNWLHAFDVYQMCHNALTHDGHAYFTNHDLIAILLGTIGHDVGHPGRTNQFQVKSSSELAITYNDKSPLESMHASLCFQTLSEPGCNFMNNAAPEDFTQIRSQMIEAILATDMVHHFGHVDCLTARVASNKEFTRDTTHSDTKTMDPCKDDRAMLMKAFVHMADIGNGCRPFGVYKHLVLALEEELFSQGDQEKVLGLPVSPMSDRSKDSLAATQDFFLSKLVEPLVLPYCTLLSPEFSGKVKTNLDSNRKTWLTLIERRGRLSAKKILALEEADEDTTADTLAGA